MEHTPIKICVCCSNAGGDPDIYFFKLDLGGDEDLFTDGEHYDIAKDIAKEQGYEHPMVVFDEFDCLFQFMDCQNKFVWDSATVFNCQIV